jgi:dolichyl-phosphate-mannose-protein mannosyltransferase
VERRDLAWLLAFTLAAAACRLPRLAFPPEEVFDEVYHAKTALQYLNGEPPTEWVHPPTAKLLIAVGIWRFGYRPLAWRLLPALAGVALAPVFYLLARFVLPTRRGAILATLLLLSDGVYLVQSRIAMTNIFAVLFQVATALFVIRAARAERLPFWNMVLVGLFFGLALSTRWTSLWAAAYLGVALVAYRRGRVLRLRELSLLFLAFLVIPVAIYIASYVPLMAQRHALSTGSGLKDALEDIVLEQGRVWHYHATLNATHPYFSKWYTWPWLVRPTWYYFHQSEGAVAGIVALGNPALWWASVPITLWALVSGFRVRDPRRIFTGLGFCALYLPWGISPRTLNYSHYLFEAIPYACLSLGMLLDAHWDEPGLKSALARGYLALVIALFLFFFPLFTALPIPSRLFDWEWGGFGLWKWFHSWI